MTESLKDNLPDVMSYPIMVSFKDLSNIISKIKAFYSTLSSLPLPSQSGGIYVDIPKLNLNTCLK